MEDIRKLRAFVLLAVGIALVAYAFLAISSLMVSMRAVLMMGSAMQPSGAVPDRAIAALFLLFLFAAGTVLVVLAAKDLIQLRKNDKEGS